ncbi:RasGEF domain-containing protein [Aquicella lusitana]|uniref:RasGEF family protein n=1 Tax=Aquicella lusitana TaxID=254246 RepID=A0A370G9F8_9COXI|nr:RasGEF domain-containing protein [Aquicella lusitana]RDI39094.1 RasGEF family protein [Aquicella lusitana]VVC73493.1 hypothetical protein AQULUS_12360 [Aquicella lusitana]
MTSPRHLQQITDEEVDFLTHALTDELVAFEIKIKTGKRFNKHQYEKAIEKLAETLHKLSEKSFLQLDNLSSIQISENESPPSHQRFANVINNISELIVKETISQKNFKDMTLIMERWIEVMNKCLQKNDFNSVQTIHSAINKIIERINPRLKEELSSKAVSTLNKVENLHLGIYKNDRPLYLDLVLKKKKVVPYFGSYKGRITLLSETLTQEKKGVQALMKLENFDEIMEFIRKAINQKKHNEPSLSPTDFEKLTSLLEKNDESIPQEKIQDIIGHLGVIANVQREINTLEKEIAGFQSKIGQRHVNDDIILHMLVQKNIGDEGMFFNSDQILDTLKLNYYDNLFAKQKRLFERYASHYRTYAEGFLLYPDEKAAQAYQYRGENETHLGKFRFNAAQEIFKQLNRLPTLESIRDDTRQINKWIEQIDALLATVDIFSKNELTHKHRHAHSVKVYLHKFDSFGFPFHFEDLLDNLHELLNATKNQAKALISKKEEEAAAQDNSLIKESKKSPYAFFEQKPEKREKGHAPPPRKPHL